jgi:hypothetical protein
VLIPHVEYGASLDVALPLDRVAGWFPKARDPMKGGFDVGAQRGPHDGVAVKDQASEVRGRPFDHLPRLDHVGSDVKMRADADPRYGA